MHPQDLRQIARQTRYPLDAFLFVQRGLDFTVRREHGEIDADVQDFPSAALHPGQGDFEEQLEEAIQALSAGHDDDADDDSSQSSRHVTGATLCDGLREYAIGEYGLLAHTVLKRWRIYQCQDFGEIVFAMVEAGMMHKTDEDSLDDFKNVFDFKTAFGASINPLLGKMTGA